MRGYKPRRARLVFDRFGPSASRREVAVEHIGIEIGAVRPHDRAKLLVHANLAEQREILAERGEDRSPQDIREVELALDSVIEPKAHYKAVERFDGTDAGSCRSRAHGSGSMVARLVRSSLRPVCFELGAMERSPLLYEPERSRWQVDRPRCSTRDGPAARRPTKLGVR